jgi:hypothetical protein
MKHGIVEPCLPSPDLHHLELVLKGEGVRRKLLAGLKMRTIAPNKYEHVLGSLTYYRRSDKFVAQQCYFLSHARIMLRYDMARTRCLTITSMLGKYTHFMDDAHVSYNKTIRNLLFLTFLVTRWRKLEGLDQRRLYFATLCLIEVGDFLSNDSDIWVIVRFKQVAAPERERTVACDTKLLVHFFVGARCTPGRQTILLVAVFCPTNSL